LNAMSPSITNDDIETLTAPFRFDEFKEAMFSIQVERVQILVFINTFGICVNVWSRIICNRLPLVRVRYFFLENVNQCP